MRSTAGSFAHCARIRRLTTHALPNDCEAFTQTFGIGVAGEARIARGLFALYDGVFLGAEVLSVVDSGGTGPTAKCGSRTFGATVKQWLESVVVAQRDQTDAAKPACCHETNQLLGASETPTASQSREE